METNGRKERRRTVDITTYIGAKVPPQARELEEAILGACMVDKEGYELAAEILKPESFYVDAHQRIFKAFGLMAKKNMPIDVLTLCQQLQTTEELDTVGGPYAVTKLTNNVTSAANIEAHCRIVQQKFYAREIIRVAGEALGEAYEDSADVFDLLDKFNTDVSKIGEDTGVSEFSDMSQNMVDFFHEIDRKKAITGDIIGVSSGLKEIDYCTLGWQPSDLIIIAARPSTGKTALVLNIAANCGINVAFFSLEMSRKQLTNRIVSAQSGIGLEVITKGKLNTFEDAEIMKATQRIENLPIFVDDNATLTHSSLRNKLKKLIRRRHKEITKQNVTRKREGLPVIEEKGWICIVDYLQLMSGIDSKQHREQEISTISRNLKKIAKELNIPMIALSQLSRDIEGRKGMNNKLAAEPRLSDLRECLSVETSLIYTQNGVQCNSNSRINLLSLGNKKIVNMQSVNIPKETNQVFRLKTTTGRFIDCTSNHPILTTDGYKKLSDIKLSDAIAIAKNWVTDNGEYIPESRFIGWMIGNGCMYGYNVPSFITRDIEISNDFVLFISKKFGFGPKFHPHYQSKVYQWDITKNSVRTAEGNPVTNWLKSKDLWGRKAKDKIIPEWFMQSADDKSICELIQGLIETDGSVEINNRTKISYSTASLTLANQILYLLARVGIIAHLDNGYLSKKATTPCYKICVESPEYKLLFSKIIPLAGYKGEKLKQMVITESPSKYSNKIGRDTCLQIEADIKAAGITKRLIQLHGERRCSQSKLKDILSEIGGEVNKKYQHLISDCIHWDCIESITELGEVEIFDRSVPGTNNFIVNGIIVHNSGAIEQDADVVAFLYCEDADREHEITIKFAKHRNGKLKKVKLRFEKDIQKFMSLDDTNARPIPFTPEKKNEQFDEGFTEAPFK